MLRARYRRILWYFARILLHLGWWDILLPRLGLRGLSERTRAQRLRQIAASFRTMAVQMGGVMIKVGQFLSSRLDVLPREITDELAGLQDEVRAETFEDIRAALESEFGARLEEKYVSFDPNPLASASIGQVHRAQMRAPAGEDPTQNDLIDVVVKVQRPNIEAIVEVDLSALRVVGRWVQRYPPIRKRANVPALLEEFSRSLYEEIDYLNEGRNAEAFAANFADQEGVCVPTVYWGWTTRRVLTMEDIRAIKITDYAAIEAAGIARSEVATRLLDTYLKQVFEDRFFHADPHPGNLFVAPGSVPGEWTLVFIDFGMTGKVSANQLAGLREMLIAVGTRDAARVIKAYQLLEVLLPNADVDLIERGTDRVFDRFWGKTTPEMMGMRQQEMASFINEFGEIIYDMPFQLPENLILLGRSLAILNGICTGLDTDFNVWNGVSPYARKLVEAEGIGNWQYWLGEIGDILKAGLGLPRRADQLITRIEQGKLELRTPDLRSSLDRVERSQRRIATSIVFGALLLGSIQLLLGGFDTLAHLAAAAAGISLLSLLLARK